jgi:hypothetical protein
MATAGAWLSWKGRWLFMRRSGGGSCLAFNFTWWVHWEGLVGLGIGWGGLDGLGGLGLMALHQSWRSGVADITGIFFFWRAFGYGVGSRHLGSG